MKARQPFSDDALAAFRGFSVNTQVIVLEYFAVLANKPQGAFLSTAEQRREKRRQDRVAKLKDRMDAFLRAESKALWNAGNAIYDKAKARERRTGKYRMTSTERTRLKAIHRRMDVNDRQQKGITQAWLDGKLEQYAARIRRRKGR